MKHPDVPRPQGRHAAAGPGPAEAANPAVLEQASLEQVIGRLGPMAPHEVAILGLAVLDQLVAVHNRGMLHGDVRPGSVLLGPHDRITLAPPTLRSPAFTAPEGVTGPAADLWSLGATLYTAAEGRPPSPGGPLDRAGPITPVLLALLSGDPGQRPEPGALRMTLLDIARRRGDVYTPLPPVPADALPPPSRRMPSTPFPVGPFVPGAIIPAPAPFPAETTTSASSPFPAETTAPPPSPFRPGAATPAPFPSETAGPAFRPAPPGATDPAPHPSRANGPAPSPSGANGPAPLPSGATGPAPLPSETTGPIPLPSGATGPASFPSEAAGPAFRPAPPGATAPAPFGTATPASSPFHPGTAPAPSPSPSPVDRPGPPLPAPPFHPEATDPAPTPATPIYPGSTASAPPPFPSEPPPQAGSAPGPDSTAPAPPFPSERTGPVQRPLQPEAPVQGPWDLHERASTPRSTPRAAPPASAVPGSQEPPPVPPGNGSPGSSGFPHSSGSSNFPDSSDSPDFPYSPGSPGFPPDSAPPFGAPMPPSPTGPPGPARRTEPARRSTGVLVPRSIVGLTGGLLAAMAVTIGVLLAPMIGGSGAGREESVSATGPAGAKGRFAAAPRACSLLDDRQADEVVPGFKSSEVEPSACEWLNQHDWRTPNSEKFDLRVRLIAQKRDGSEIKRAREYLSGKRKDFVDNAKHATPRPVPPQDLKGVGEDAFTTGVYSPINIYGGSYKVTVVLRVSNLIAEVQYERGSVKEDSDGRITQDALKVARWITESLKTRG